MWKHVKTILLTGSVALCTMCVPVCGASLEDSMLQAPSGTPKQSNDDSDSKEASAFQSKSKTITSAADLTDLTQDERVQKIGEMCQEDYQESGVLASVSAAQCILESGYLLTTLATQGNNCFGMKATLSGNDWDGSTWDGVSVCTKQTGEEYNGQNVTIIADFRKYNSIEESVADHSAYLLGATVDGGALRYDGLKGETDYRQAITIIRNGGYATDSSYIDKICSIIERFDLTKFDQIDGTDTDSASKTEKQKAAAKEKNTKTAASASTSDELYRVRKSWEDASSQLGAFKTLSRAQAACKEGYHVYDNKGNEV